jgi:hypothetical protein
MPELTLTTRTELSHLAGAAAGHLVADVSIFLLRGSADQPRGR